jgi:hypothetical protein
MARIGFLEIRLFRHDGIKPRNMRMNFDGAIALLDGRKGFKRLENANVQDEKATRNHHRKRD